MTEDNAKTVKELRAELIGLGFDKEAAKGIRSKNSLQATIDLYKDKKAASADSVGEQEETEDQLRADLVGLGFDENAAKNIHGKEALRATIAIVKEKKPAGNVDQTTPEEDRETERHWQAKADRMAEHLHSQNKIRVLIPLEPNEKVGVVKEVEKRGVVQYEHVSGAVWSKTFNGYKVIVPKGVYYPVPQQIADNIATELNQTQMAGQHLKIDRVDPNTGKPVADQLS